MRKLCGALHAVTAPWSSCACTTQWYLPPSAKVPAGGVHVGWSSHVEVASRPVWPSAPVATWKRYFTGSPSSSTTASAANDSVVVPNTLSAVGVRGGGTAGEALLTVNERAALHELAS